MEKVFFDMYVKDAGMWKGEEYEHLGSGVVRVGVEYGEVRAYSTDSKLEKTVQNGYDTFKRTLRIGVWAGFLLGAVSGISAYKIMNHYMEQNNAAVEEIKQSNENSSTYTRQECIDKKAYIVAAQN